MLSSKNSDKARQILDVPNIYYSKLNFARQKCILLQQMSLRGSQYVSIHGVALQYTT